MVELNLSKIGRGAKWAVVGAIKGAGDTVETVIQATRDVFLVAVDGVSQVVVAAEKDTVIPDGVIRKICESAGNAEELVQYTIADAPHFVLTYLRKENPSELTALMTRMVEMLKE